MALKRGPDRAGRTRFLALVSALFIILVIGVFAAGCGSGSTTTTATSSGSGAGGPQVVMKNFAFDPASVTVKVGDSVTWTNQDSATHTVVADNGEFKSSDLGQGDAFTFKFDKAGSFPFHCGIHPTMKGTVVVQ